MDIRLSSGAVISTDNPEIIEQHLKYGGVQITTEVEEKVAPKKTTKKVQD